jgi:hypothetical protein
LFENFAKFLGKKLSENCSAEIEFYKIDPCAISPASSMPTAPPPTMMTLVALSIWEQRYDCKKNFADFF